MTDVDKDAPVKVEWIRSTRRAVAYIVPYWPLAAGALGAAVALSGLALLTPWPIKIVVDNVIQGAPLPNSLRPIAALLPASRIALLVTVALFGFAISLTVDAISVISAYLSTRLNLGMTLDFRSELFQHAQRMSMAFHDRKKSGMLIYVINSMADAPTSLVLTILPLLQNILTLIGMFWVSFRISPTLALAAMVIVPFIYYAI